MLTAIEIITRYGKANSLFLATIYMEHHLGTKEKEEKREKG